MPPKKGLPTPETPAVERPCGSCHHLHEGKCQEDGCGCEVSVPAEVPHQAERIDLRTDSETISAGGEPAGGNTERNDGAAGLDKQVVEGDPAASQQPYDAGLRNSLPIQERIANVIEDFEAENGRWPIGCELIISGKIYQWTGEKMEEAPEPTAAPPAPAPTVLSDEDQAKLREFFAEQGEVKELPDGSVMLPMRIDADQIHILKAWAEGAGEHWISYAQRTLDIGLNAVINGGAVAG